MAARSGRERLTMSMRRGRLGWGQRLAVGVAAALVISLTFVVGVLVGRQWAPRHAPAPAAAGGQEALRAEAAPDSGPPPEPGRSSAPAARPERERPEKEKLTFYNTLTAPVAAAGGRPPAPIASWRAPRCRPHAPEPGRDPAAAAPRSLATTAAGAPTPAPVAGTSPGDDGRSGGRWAVQVGAFKNRDQAESIQRRLSDSGDTVSISSVTASDGSATACASAGTEAGARPSRWRCASGAAAVSARS